VFPSLSQGVMPGMNECVDQVCPPLSDRLTPQPSLRFQSFQPVIRFNGWSGLCAIVISLFV